jgi:hypothetical protein
MATAIVSTGVVLAWQYLNVHFNYRDDWTALYDTGAYARVPPGIDHEEVYRFRGQPGYDGQFYHFIAHDPWLRHGSAPYVDNPRLRWRRILVPAMAWLCALGQSDFVDSAYFAVVIGWVFLGVFWLSRYLERYNLPPQWGAVFALVPAVLISLDRATVDVALAALCVGFALYTAPLWGGPPGPRPAPWPACGGPAPTRDMRVQGDPRGPGGPPHKLEQWTLCLILALAPLARETGACLIVAYVVVQLRRRDWRAAGRGATTALPFLLWTLYLNAHTAGDHTVFASLMPLKGLVLRTLQPIQYATPTAWLRKAAVLDFLAILGIWAALLGSPTNWFSFDELEGAALAFAATALFLAQPQAWGEAYSFGRTLSPLLLTVALAGVRRRRWWTLAPICMVLPRILFQLAAEWRGVWHGLIKSA